jgi:hypothetical protein
MSIRGKLPGHCALADSAVTSTPRRDAAINTGRALPEDQARKRRSRIARNCGFIPTLALGVLPDPEFHCGVLSEGPGKDDRMRRVRQRMSASTTTCRDKPEMALVFMPHPHPLRLTHRRPAQSSLSRPAWQGVWTWEWFRQPSRTPNQRALLYAHRLGWSRIGRRPV